MQVPWKDDQQMIILVLIILVLVPVIDVTVLGAKRGYDCVTSLLANDNARVSDSTCLCKRMCVYARVEGEEGLGERSLCAA